MRLNYVVTATTAALLLTAAGLAEAQQSPPSGSTTMPPSAQTPRPAAGGGGSLAAGSLHEIGDKNAMAAGLNVSAKDLDGMDILGADSKKIGDVKKVLADSSNSIKAVTVDVGGFLGLGSHEVILPIDKLQKGLEKDKLHTSMTKADIEKLDEWKSPSRTQRSSSPGAAGPSTSPGAAPPRTGPGSGANR